MSGNIDLRILSMMEEKIDRLIEVAEKYSLEEIENNFLLSDTIQFEFEKLYEDSRRLSPVFCWTHPNLPINDLRAIRNRVAHDYESVSLRILVNTIKIDLPGLKTIIRNLQEELK